MAFAANPFAAGGCAPTSAMPGMGMGGRTGSATDPTGPILGRGSDLQRLYNMPEHMGHGSGVQCMAMVDDKIFSGGRDEGLFVWRGAPDGPGMQLVQDAEPIGLGSAVNALHYDQASKWLFCGLWNGDVRGFCRDPGGQDCLKGHRRCVSSITTHSGVVITGSTDGTVRLWTADPAAGRFKLFGQPINNPSGPVSCVKVLGDALWVGGQQGVTCLDLGTMQPRGVLRSAAEVTQLMDFEGHMVAAYSNGEVKIFNASGVEAFVHPALGEHRTNVACELMVHPTAQKPMLLCGQQYGYITAYDLPDFRARGSWCCRNNSDIRAILDTKAGGVFCTGGAQGDIMMWQWTQGGGSGPTGGGAVSASPFAASPCGGGNQACSNPFAGGAGGAQQAGGFPGGVAGNDTMM